MEASKRNDYWKLTKNSGQPKKFKNPEELLQSALNYFKWADENPWIKKDIIRGGHNAGSEIDIKLQRPYTIEGFCLFNNVTRQTFLNYESKDEYAEYFDVIAYIRATIETNQLEGATVGSYNANIISRKLGLEDSKKLSGDIGISGTIKINYK